MNRLIIIGNGFDLAHGLPTGYCDFIDGYWRNLSNSIHEDECIKVNFDLIGMKDSFDNFVEVEKWIQNYGNNSGSGWSSEFDGNSYFLYVPTYVGSIQKIEVLKFKNVFFRIINQYRNIENWVDVEKEYYFQLKKIAKSNETKRVKKEEIKNLNSQFEDVKNLLEKYLNEKVIDKYNLKLSPDPTVEMVEFNDVIKPISLSSKENNLLDEFPSNNHDEIKEQFDYEVQGMKSNTKLFFLDFNYTPTIYRYLKNGKYNDDIETHVNFIHGEVGNSSHNKINFGFGDEMDDDYKMIENLNDNEYLKNFKSFQYLQNSNYKKLLDFVETENYQVYIMGHSCGLSDRTLLNTIFEHNNCRSIKVFYHQKEDGSDNYTELIQNISRHFNKKKLMREKIVNKTLCQPLPKLKLPEKAVMTF